MLKVSKDYKLLYNSQRALKKSQMDKLKKEEEIRELIKKYGHVVLTINKKE